MANLKENSMLSVSIILPDSDIPQQYFHTPVAWLCPGWPINVVTRRAELVALDNSGTRSGMPKGKLLADTLGKHVAS